ncbi:MAG TPA: hypothetical protein PKE58_17065, partial [Acidobacteriota bacterium]|nr:hypothetical protein [Acidobacteriota bacterium]
MQDLNIPMLISIRKIDQAQPALSEELVELLIDSVSNGASVGFLNPVNPSTAREYWHNVLSTPEDEL